MDHYLDIRLRTDPEFPPHQLLSALYTKLHRALVQLGSTEIGVSFPEQDLHKPSLGSLLRLHGPHPALQALMDSGWTNGLRDYLQLRPIHRSPDGVPHRCVSRVQAKSGVERMRRRAMRRHGIDEATAAARIPDQAAKQLALPFVQLGSASTGQPNFLLFIRHGDPQEQSVPGAFNSYGLSGAATVPWF